MGHAASNSLAQTGSGGKAPLPLAYVQDELYRRLILVQPNRGAGRHVLARAVFHGKKGELRQRYCKGMGD